MKSRLLFQVLILALAASFPLLGLAQIDLTQVTADPKTYRFSDGSDVKEYIVNQLRQQTSCCGSEKLYLEVRIDQTGYVKEAKALTGKGECFKKSAIDIVKNIRWNNAGLTGAKTVYFEINPNIACEGRANAYTALPITNNPLLAGTVAPLPATEPVAAPPAPQPVQPAAQPVAPAVQPQPETPVLATTQPAPQPVPQPAPQPAPQQVVPATQPQPAPAFTDQMPPQNQPAARTAPASGSTVEQRMAEIQQLQKQLNEMKAAEDARLRLIAEAKEAQRQREEADRKRKEEEEAKKKEAEAAAAAAMAARNAPPAATPAPKSGTTPGGKKVEDEDPYGTKVDYSNISYDETPGAAQNRPGAGKPGPIDSVAKTDPNVAKLTALQQQLATLEAQNKMNQNAAAQQQAQYNNLQAQIRKVQAEIRAAEEEEKRKQEQAELDRIAAEQKAFEAKKQETQEAIERAQKEMQRIQDEIQRKMAEIDRFAQEAATAEQKRQAYEQKIMIERKQREAEIMPVASVADIAPLTVTMPTDTTPMGLLIYQVNLLTQQLNNMQRIIANLQNGNTDYSTQAGRGIQQQPAKNGGTTPVPAGAPIFSAAAVKTAADDQTWQDVNYTYTKSTEDGRANAEAIQEGIKINQQLTGAAKQNAPATPGRTTNNVVPSPGNQAHDDIHVNTPGPALNRPEYQDGENGMKEYIRSELRRNGVCGLAQAAFEVTVNPRGEVVGYRVLAANTPQVYSLMPGILSSLKFRPSSNRFNQNTYLEFKTEVRCDAGPASAELETTPNYIDVPTNK